MAGDDGDGGGSGENGDGVNDMDMDGMVWDEEHGVGVATQADGRLTCHYKTVERKRTVGTIGTSNSNGYGGLAIGTSDAFNCRRHIVFIIVFVMCCAIRGNSAGFACLSNPCVFGVCIDDLNRLVLNIDLVGFTCWP